MRTTCLRCCGPVMSTPSTSRSGWVTIWGQRLHAVLVPHAFRLREAARLGAADVALSALDEHRLLCADRRGPFGVTHWNANVQRWIAEETGQPPWSEWYAGRSLLVTANDYGRASTTATPVSPWLARTGLRAVIAGATGSLNFATSRLGDVETMHAMTIHKSQGSQADEVTVLMPPQDSRLLTRELFYTAVTRAKAKVRWWVPRLRYGQRSGVRRCGRRGYGNGRRTDGSKYQASSVSALARKG
jgi:exodeoxyribonuclease V alpha subunit